MVDLSLLSRIEFRAPTAKLAEKGLVAWVDCDHAAIRLRGIELRRRRDGELAISFPPTRIVQGRLSCAAKPVSDSARIAIQREIIAAATREGLLS